MNLLLKLSLLFCMGCSVGWVLELFFRRFFSKENVEHKWINPGFLSGPWIPLYGLGLCAIYLLSGIEGQIPGGRPLKALFIIILVTLCSTLIEYVAGLFCVKILKVNLWNYSDEWGNVGGIICPRFSLFWAILGAIYLFFIHGSLSLIVDRLSQKPICALAVGFYLGTFSADVIYSYKSKSYAKSTRNR